MGQADYECDNNSGSERGNSVARERLQHLFIHLFISF